MSVLFETYLLICVPKYEVPSCIWTCSVLRQRSSSVCRAFLPSAGPCRPENEERTNVICSLENWERSNDDAFVADILHADAQGLAVLIDLARAPSECGRGESRQWERGAWVKSWCQGGCLAHEVAWFVTIFLHLRQKPLCLLASKQSESMTPSATLPQARRPNSKVDDAIANCNCDRTQRETFSGQRAHHSKRREWGVPSADSGACRIPVGHAKASSGSLVLRSTKGALRHRPNTWLRLWLVRSSLRLWTEAGPQGPDQSLGQLLLAGSASWSFYASNHAAAEILMPVMGA